jgi:glycosyltransferase involved in cell wall biosynthesis
MTDFQSRGSVATAASEPCSDPPQSTSIEVCIVGPGWRFTSGITYYTCRLASALVDHHAVSVIQLRRLLPKRFYPGRERVGRHQNPMAMPPDVAVFDGIDWWWGLSLLRALAFMRRKRPRVLILEWWTATALHTYLVLAIAARLMGTTIVLEMHESQDPGEASFGLARRYGRWGLGVLFKVSHGCVLHSKADLCLIEESYRLTNVRVGIAPHGPYDLYQAKHGGSQCDEALVAAVREAPRPGVINLLFFGLIRPYKGLEDLLLVYNGLSKDEVSKLWLTVVGETWDGCTDPARLIAESPHRERISFVNEYVSDDVVSAAFAHADVVVLPYHRSSSSGTLHIAMSLGLPVVVTNVGGLPEAADGYEGAIFVPPHDPLMLKEGITRATKLAGRRFRDPRDWAETADAVFLAAGISPLKLSNHECLDGAGSRRSLDPGRTD